MTHIDIKGIRMTESSNINTSLFVLGKVVDALNEGSVSDIYLTYIRDTTFICVCACAA